MSDTGELTYEEVYSYVEQDWQEQFRQYAKLHNALFDTTSPFAGALRTLVHGHQGLPQPSVIACALAIIAGDTEGAMGQLPLDRKSTMLLIACRAGNAVVSAALLEDADFDVDMDHLEAAIDAKNWEIVGQLLDTGNFGVYVNLDAILRERVPSHVLADMGRGDNGWCYIL